MPFYIGPFTRPVDHTSIHHVRAGVDAEDFEPGYVVECHGYVFEWDDDCVRGSQLNRWRSVADPLCDIALKTLFPSVTGSVGADMLEVLRGQAEHQDGPSRDFYEEVLQLPPPHIRATPGEIVRGQAFFFRYASSIMSSLLHFSLAGGFASPRINRVLHAVSYLTPQGSSSEYSQQSLDRIYGRLLETFQFVLDVMGQSDIKGGTFQPQSEGWKSAVRVRMLHGVARRRILERYNADPDTYGAAGYDFGADGYPINQEDMAATLGSFSVAPLRCLDHMGFSVSDQERSDFIALWRHIGFYMGIDPEILSRHFMNWHKSMKFTLSTIIHLIDFSDEANGKPNLPILALPILQAVSNRSPGYTTPQYHYAMSRYLVGNEMADSLGLPQASLLFSLSVLAAVTIGRLAPTLGKYYRFRHWEERRIALMREGMSKLVSTQLGLRRTQFRPRDNSMELSPGVQAAEKLSPGPPASRQRFMREYRDLVIEMFMVLGTALGVMVVISWAIWRWIGSQIMPLLFPGV